MADPVTTNGDDSFKITPPGWIKSLGMGVGKWGPAWVLLGIVSWFLYTSQRDEIVRRDTREREVFQLLYDTIIPMNAALTEHTNATLRSQLFISVMCANNANSTSQAKACFDEETARNLKEYWRSR